MDIIESIDAIFDDILPRLIEHKTDVAEFKKILMDAKLSVIRISASNPLNTEYILGSITPVTYPSIIIE